MKTQERRPTPDEIPGQKLDYPAKQSDMTPQPDSDLSNYRPASKLQNKVALITGGDSGIGRAVAIAYAMEGANVAILYNENDEDAETTQSIVAERGSECLTLKFDVRDKDKGDNYDTDAAMKRAGQPEELAPAYVYLAAEDSSFVAGALLDVTGGMTSS
ncbi:MAG: SDR family oxidoreductase [Leptolyngbyaceae cyanobacterium]